MQTDKFRAAVIQMCPVYLNPEATVEKIIVRLHEAAAGGARLVVLPEAMIAGYPNWVNLHNPFTSTWDAGYWERFIVAAVTVEDLPIRRLRAAVAEHGLYLVTGLVERDPLHSQVLYNSSVLIGPDGEILGRHRKLLPIRQELLYFRKGDATDVQVFPTAVGRLGIGICAEHYHPLYRHGLACLGEQIHCGLWINVSGISHMVDAMSRSVAIENGVFVLVACQVADTASSDRCELPFIGGSGIIAPSGHYLTGPLYDTETILYADLEARSLAMASTLFTSVGRENMEALFRFEIRRDSPGS